MKTSFELPDINWGGEGYPAYDGFMSTSTVTPAATGAPPATPAPAASPASTPTSAVPTASPAGDSAGASSAPTGNEANIKQLREGYDKYKSLGDYETVSERHGTMTKLWDEASQTATKLGYDAKELEAAFKHDPIATMYILRREAKQAATAASKPGTPQNIQTLVQKELDRALAPEREERARQIATTRMKDFESETSAFIEKEYPGIAQSAPKAYTLFGEIAAALLDRRLSSDEKLLNAFLKGSAPAILKESHAAAKEIFNSALTEFQTWQMKKNNLTPNTPGSGGAERPKFSLQDAIDGNDNATKHIASLRR